MAKVQGVKEKLHSPLYDAHFVKDGVRFDASMTDSRAIRFFMDVQSKTKLETNMQSSGSLPSLNTFEARAMRVVVSSPRFFGELLKEPPILADLIYNSVTTLIVGEKVMIEMPTYFFPSGAGVTPGLSNASQHGEADPMATFRFAEPVFIESQQNFRVELLFPQGIPAHLAELQGPLRIWVVLDGYLTRDVQ